MAKDAAAARIRARRLDRGMAWLITLGGVGVIGAVLGILLFIGKEAYPLFRPARSHALAPGRIASAAALAAEEGGGAAAALDPARGVTVAGVPAAAQDGPALPWRAWTGFDARGRFAVQGGDGRLGLATLQWQGPAQAAPAWAILARSAPVRLLDAVPLDEGGPGAARWRVAALDAGNRLVWAEATEDAPGPLAWAPLPAPADIACARWNGPATMLYVGSRDGGLRLIQVEPEAGTVAEARFEEPVTALGFALGHTSLLVGGAHGGMAAYQVLNQDGRQTLQRFHAFQRLDGAVGGFMPGLRDKRFLAWSDRALAVDHLTTGRRLFQAAPGPLATAALSARGDRVFAAGADGTLRAWALDAPHPEISAQALWGKVHYESYPKPELVWQSSGGTDDFEPKLSLVPLVFGTLKGTLYAMLFALPLAILGALYTSQFASPRLRGLIKPLVEIMAALPSVVLGFLAGLVLAPLFERSAMQVAVLPGVALMMALLALPLWRRLPRRLRLGWGTGWEVLWLIPFLLLAGVVSAKAGPWLERAWLGGDFRAWLLAAKGVTYDQRNSLVVGFAMGFAVIPIIFTISEDALSAVPKSLSSASLACGASPWQTAWRVVLPTASPGIFSAVMVGLGRAIGETMIVLMATGNTPLMDFSPFNGMRTLAANIAVETPEAPVHGTLYRLLFFTAALLFGLTFLLNTVAEVVRQRLRKRYESF